ncbi:hypothetical protein Pmi06nite_47970 [Planotetraspora mira]|uniref:Uncharacterized protein n=1 Tax=Planotetraspora mira TaxID=58121 RepID=A0A8J3X861_9ACTN|nr:hypothetical protein Pmi06nite_47970 [Planotetraspora mira]
MRWTLPKWAGGRPSPISPDDEAFIVAMALTRPEKLGRQFTHWSLRKLAAHLAEHPERRVRVGRERLFDSDGRRLCTAFDAALHRPRKVDPDSARSPAK